MWFGPGERIPRARSKMGKQYNDENRRCRIIKMLNFAGINLEATHLPNIKRWYHGAFYSILINEISARPRRLCPLFAGFDEEKFGNFCISVTDAPRQSSSLPIMQKNAARTLSFPTTHQQGGLFRVIISLINLLNARRYHDRNTLFKCQKLLLNFAFCL